MLVMHPPVGYAEAHRFDASSVPDDSGETSLCLAKILDTSFPISLWVICSMSVKLEASRTRSPMKPYVHLPLFFSTLSRYLSAYPWINFSLVNLLRSSKCRYGPLALLVFCVLFFFGMKAVIQQRTVEGNASTINY